MYINHKPELNSSSHEFKLQHLIIIMKWHYSRTCCCNDLSNLPKIVSKEKHSLLSCYFLTI